MAWYNSSWSKRKAITLTGGSSGAQTDYQVKLTVTYDSDMKSDFSDLRFTKADGTTLLDAWMESHTASTSAVIWIETDTPANTVEADIYMYYGNSGASSDWDIGATFILGDDFNDNSIDTGKWNTASATATVTETSEQLHVVSSGGKYLHSAQSDVPTNFRFRAKCKSNVHQVMVFPHSDGSGDPWSDTNDTGGLVRTGHNDIKIHHDGTENTTSVTLTNNTWYIMEMLTDGTSSSVLVYNSGGTYMNTVTATVTNAPTGRTLAFRGYNETIDFDWVFYGKYASNPATYSVGSEEDKPSDGSAMWYWMLLRRRNN